MAMAVEESTRQKQERPWYLREPALIWAIVVGVAAVWRYATPVVFNDTLVGCLVDVEWLAGMIDFAPFPEIEDDRVILRNTGLNTIAIAFINGFPNLFHRGILRWNLLMIPLTLVLALIMAFVYTPNSQVLWIGIYFVFSLAAIAAAGKVFLGWLSAPLDLPDASRPIAAGIICLLGGVLLFWLIPAACARWSSQSKSWLLEPEPRMLFLLHMKDRGSPLHEEIVDILVPGKDYLVVRASEQVPHPRLLPGSPESMSTSTGQYIGTFTGMYCPMLIARDTVECITSVPSPRVMRGILKDFAAKEGAVLEEPVTITRADGGGWGFECTLRSGDNSIRLTSATSQPHVPATAASMPGK